MSCSPVRECGRRLSMRSAAPPVRGAASCTTFSPTRRTWFPTWSGSRSTGCCRRSSRHSTTSTRPPISAPGAPTHSARTHLLTIPSAAHRIAGLRTRPLRRWPGPCSAQGRVRPLGTGDRRRLPAGGRRRRVAARHRSRCPGCRSTRRLPGRHVARGRQWRCRTAATRAGYGIGSRSGATPQTQAIPVAARLPLQRQLRNALMSRCRNSGSSSSVPILPTVATVLRNCWR